MFSLSYTISLESFELPPSASGEGKGGEEGTFNGNSYNIPMPAWTGGIDLYGTGMMMMLMMMMHIKLCVFFSSSITKIPLSGQPFKRIVLVFVTLLHTILVSQF